MAKKKTKKTPEKKKTLYSSLTYRTYASTVRTWQIFSAMEAVIIIMLTAAIVAMMPLKEIEVRYIEFTSSNDNFFTVYPSDMPKKTGEMLVRKQLRNYVYNREKRDGATEALRFGEVKAMSSDTVFIAFKELYYDSRDVFEDINREIQIVSDTPLQKDLHQIEFQTIDTRNGILKRSSFFAVVEYTVIPQIVNDETAMLNPMGINVTNYVLSKREEE